MSREIKHGEEDHGSSRLRSDARVAKTQREVEPSADALPAVCYTIRNGWAWAHIFVRHGLGKMHDGSPRHWANVSVISDFGNFGYCWTHMGCLWSEFLPDLNFDYAMQKFMGERYTVPLSIDEAAEKGRALVLQYRREGSLDRGDARKLWDGLADAGRDVGLGGFLRDWDRCSGGAWYAHEWWDHRWDKVNPQAEGFWSNIWPHFIAALSSDPQPLGSAREATEDGQHKTNPEPGEPS